MQATDQRQGWGWAHKQLWGPVCQYALPRLQDLTPGVCVAIEASGVSLSKGTHSGG